MIIEVTVHPRAKHGKVEKRGNKFHVYVTAPAEDGKANVACGRVLAEFLNVKDYHLTLHKGRTSKNKLFSFNEI